MRTGRGAKARARAPANQRVRRFGHASLCPPYDINRPPPRTGESGCGRARGSGQQASLRPSTCFPRQWAQHAPKLNNKWTLMRVPSRRPKTQGRRRSMDVVFLQHLNVVMCSPKTATREGTLSVTFSNYWRNYSRYSRNFLLCWACPADRNLLGSSRVSQLWPSSGILVAGSMLLVYTNLARRCLKGSRWQQLYRIHDSPIGFEVRPQGL